MPQVSDISWFPSSISFMALFFLLFFFFSYPLCLFVSISSYNFSCKSLVLI